MATWAAANSFFFSPFSFFGWKDTNIFGKKESICIRSGIVLQGPHYTGKTGKVARENTGNLEVLPKHREFCLLKL